MSGGGGGVWRPGDLDGGREVTGFVAVVVELELEFFEEDLDLDLLLLFDFLAVGASVSVLSKVCFLFFSLPLV